MLVGSNITIEPERITFGATGMSTCRRILGKVDDREWRGVLEDLEGAEITN